MRSIGIMLYKLSENIRKDTSYSHDCQFFEFLSPLNYESSHFSLKQVSLKIRNTKFLKLHYFLSWHIKFILLNIRVRL